MSPMRINSLDEDEDSLLKVECHHCRLQVDMSELDQHERECCDRRLMMADNKAVHEETKVEFVSHIEYPPYNRLLDTANIVITTNSSFDESASSSIANGQPPVM